MTDIIQEYDVIIVGGGASGLYSAVTASNLNKKVLLLEKNEKTGKKLYITGKGRCNVTNDCNEREFLENVVTNSKFLIGAIYSCPSEKIVQFFNDNNCKLKTERGNRVFPLSDKASDITKTLEKTCLKQKVDIKLNTEVKEIIIEEGVVKGVCTEYGNYYSRSVIICTGGVSYPLTGSTGDGYRFAKESGHTVIKPKPSLCGINLNNGFLKELQGLSLKNVVFTVFFGEKVVFSELGEMIFTHFGVSGPIVLSASAYINKLDGKNITLEIDFKPALTEDVLEKRIIRELAAANTKHISSAAATLVPKTFVKTFLKTANVKSDKKCCEITTEERLRMVKTLKFFRLNYNSLRPIEEAIITSGGVNVKEINPKTMESKLVKNLFFAGEVLDVDALTGGFNLQTAFCTAYLAGINA